MQELEQLGLARNEAKIYEALLRIGLSSTTQIAKECRLHRTNVYDVMDKLVRKGLVSHITKDNATFYEANDPKVLLRLVKEQENVARSIIPQLELSKRLAKSTGEAHVFEGEQAFVNILYSMLEHKEEILAYGIPRQAPVRMRTRIPHFHKERIKGKIPMRHLYNFRAKERIDELNAMSLTKARFLPPSFDSQVSTTVCGDEVAISVWTKPLITIHIRNTEAASTYKRYFTLLWKAAQ